MYRILTQQRNDSNKVYSIHEPDVHCIANIPFDGHTLLPQLEQVEELTGLQPRYAIVDRGYRGQNQFGNTNVVMPKNLKRESRYLKKKREERCRSRSGIEGLISHLKLDHRMLRNYLKGTQGDKINTLLAAAAYNMKKWMARHRHLIFVFLRFLFFRTQVLVPIYTEISGIRKYEYL